MSKIKEKFAELEAKNQKALISYIMVGFPSEKATIAAVRGLVKGGADIIELGFPFSDPIADGPLMKQVSVFCMFCLSLAEISVCSLFSFLIPTQFSII